MHGRDITGQTFGYLTALGLSDEKCCLKYKWRFRCVCGKELNIVKQSVVSGRTRSCGCKAAELGRSHPTHGFNKTKIQQVYRNMMMRCYNQNNADYPNYGGRGIEVCSEWKGNLGAFGQWAIASGYAPTLYLDRIDNDGLYAPYNCRWVTPKESANNRRACARPRFKHDRGSLRSLCASAGLPYIAVRNRLYRGWDLDRALTTPVKPHRHK